MKSTFYIQRLIFNYKKQKKLSLSFHLFSLLFAFLFSSEDALASHNHNKKTSSKRDTAVSQTDPIECLPMEMFVRVGYLLPPSDRGRARQVSHSWSSVFSWAGFVFKAQINLRGDLLEGGLRYFFTDDERSHFVPKSPTSLNRVRQIQLVGPYPGEKSPAKKREIVDQKLESVFHPNLTSLSWVRSSRHLPIEPLVTLLPRVKHLRSLSLREGVLKDLSLLPLLTSNALENLEHLDLSRNCLSVLTLQHLRESNLRLTLKSLLISGNSVGVAVSSDEDVPFIYPEENDGFPELQILDVSKNSLTIESRFLEDLGSYPNLQTLKLSQNALGTDGLTPWLALPKDGGLLSLDVRSIGIVDLTVLDTGSCNNLINLNLAGNPLGENITDLPNLNCRLSLQTLSLSQCGLKYDSLKNILRAPYPSITSLVLSNNTLGIGSAELLAHTPHFPSLSRLALMHTHTPWSELKQLVCARPLTFLDMRRNLGVCPRALRKALDESEYEGMEILPTPQMPSPPRATFSYKVIKNRNKKHATKKVTLKDERNNPDYLDQISTHTSPGRLQNMYSVLENM